MIILGLTGSIGSGKTTAAGMLASFRLPVFDADAVVHRLLSAGGAGVSAVRDAFPGAVVGQAGHCYVDRAKLGQSVFNDASALGRLEAILHPLVRDRERQFCARARRLKIPIVVLDIPLLFETGGETRCDATIVVTAPRFLQAQRVLRRPGMSRRRLEQVLARQMPDAEKRRRADFVVPTGLGYADTRRRLEDIVAKLRAHPEMSAHA